MREMLTKMGNYNLKKIIGLIRTYFRQSWSDKLFLLYIFVLLGIVRLVLLIVPFRRIAPLLGAHMVESPYDDMSENIYVRRVGWAVAIISRHTLWESKCLVQAVTGKILLRHYCLSNTLYLGVAKDENRNMIAHAWLRSGDIVATGNLGAQKFTIVSKFADNFEKHS